MASKSFIKKISASGKYELMKIKSDGNNLSFTYLSPLIQLLNFGARYDFSLLQARKAAATSVGSLCLSMLVRVFCLSLISVSQPIISI